MVIRLQQKMLTEAAVAHLNEIFGDILQSGSIVQTVALPEEQNEPDLLALPRIVFTPHRTNFGRLRLLIDAVNDADVVA